MKIILITIVSILIIASCVSFKAKTAEAKNSIDLSSENAAYDNCVLNGGKVLKSYPPKCVDAEGNVFIQVIKK